MTPNNIVGMAEILELPVFAVSDHNSAQNLPAVCRLGAEQGILVVPAIEITTAEEVHVLSFFPDLTAALDMGEELYAALPRVANRPEIFGDQLILDEEDRVTGQVEKLLINAVSFSIETVFEKVRQRVRQNGTLAQQLARMQQQMAQAKATPTPTPVPQPSYDDDYSGESFAWPVPGWTGVSCAFGNGHYGMDIPASRGTQIVASRSGRVMTANGSDDWGYSWGYYVSIYHDSTYSTLYAHMSSVAVSEGQWVNKGDVIGYVGDTGYSFGDHCHFEVYQNGTRVDPSQFV